MGWSAKAAAVAVAAQPVRVAGCLPSGRMRGCQNLAGSALPKERSLDQGESIVASLPAGWCLCRGHQCHRPGSGPHIPSLATTAPCRACDTPGTTLTDTCIDGHAVSCVFERMVNEDHGQCFHSILCLVRRRSATRLASSCFRRLAGWAVLIPVRNLTAAAAGGQWRTHGQMRISMA